MSAAVQQPLSSISDTPDLRKSIYQAARRKSGFSFRHSLSFRRSNSAHNLPTKESHEKSKRPQSKVDPLAILENQSSPVGSEMNITLAPIRAIQHRDINGNPISEPDRSNPTRSRWERPLDTIRSFEAAVDWSYIRQSQMRNERNDSRRNSYASAHQNTPNNKVRHRPHTYCGGSFSPLEYSNSVDNSGINNATYFHRARSSRPDFNHSNIIYSVPDVQESSEYVDSAISGSSSSVDPAYTTGPSSEGSSIDRVSPISHKELYHKCDSRALPASSSRLQIDESHNQQYEKKKEPIQMRTDPSSRNISIGQDRIDIQGNSFSPMALATGQPTQKRKSWFSKRLSRVS